MRFDRHERQAFWRGLWTDFPHGESVIIYAALDSPELLPLSSEFARWESSKRVLRP